MRALFAARSFFFSFPLFVVFFAGPSPYSPKCARKGKWGTLLGFPVAGCSCWPPSNLSLPIFPPLLSSLARWNDGRMQSARLHARLWVGGGSCGAHARGCGIAACTLVFEAASGPEPAPSRGGGCLRARLRRRRRWPAHPRARRQSVLVLRRAGPRLCVSAPSKQRRRDALVAG